MRTVIAICCLVLTFGTPALAWEARIVSVTDGDTLTIEDTGGKRTRVRLLGLDAPERDQPGGAAATSHLLAIALWQTVDVKGMAYDSYARLLAVLVRPEGWSINGNMVRMGHAWASGKRWKKSEDRAKLEHRGLWRYADPVKPSKWRKTQKQLNKERL